MPTVPRRQREVSTAPIPGVRKRFASTAAAEGAGVERATADRGEAIAGVGNVVARFGQARFNQVVEEERDRADRAALLEAENALSKWENERLYSQGGALTVKGKDAFPLPEKLAEEYNAVAGEAEKKLTSARQKEAFATLRVRRGQNLDLTIRRHVFGEMQAYHRGELQASIENGVNTAIANANDPRRVGEELSNVIATIKANGPSLGMGAEQIEQQITKVQSTTHVGVIDRLLAQDRDKAAKIYLEETRGQISGDSLAKIERAIEEGSLRGEAQRKADEILTAGGTLSQQREKARAIDDPQLRDQVMQRIEHEATIRDRQDREREEANSIEAYNIIDRTGNVARIPPALWTSFSGNQRAGMIAYARAKARGVDIETDFSVYYSMMQQAANDPQGFAQENLLNSRGKLGDTEFKQLADLQLAIKNGNRKAADEELDLFRTHKQVIDDTLALYSIDPNPKETDDRRAIAQLQRMLGARMEMLTSLTGKKPRNADVQDALDDLLGKSVKTEGSWWWLWQNRSTKRLIDVTYDDIPADQKPLIEKALRGAGREVTPETVLDLYLETKARERK